MNNFSANGLSLETKILGAAALGWALPDSSVEDSSEQTEGNIDLGDFASLIRFVDNKDWFGDSLEKDAFDDDGHPLHSFAATVQTGEIEAIVASYEQAIDAAGDELLAYLADEESNDSSETGRQAVKDTIENAMQNLGCMVLDSCPDKAKALLKRAAEAGNEYALDNVRIVESDSEYLQGLYQRLIDQGDAYAPCSMANMVRNENLDKAKELYQIAVGRGNADAMNKLAMIVEEEDPEQAQELYRKATDLGNMYAPSNLANLIRESEPDHAKELYELAMERGNDVAPNELAVWYYEDSDPKKRELYEIAIERGNVMSMNNLANLIREEDLKRAKELYEKATDLGNMYAPNNLAWYYYKDSDPDKAKELYGLATERGNAAGMVNLAGFVLDDDPDYAKELYRKATELGNMQAPCLLANMIREEDPEYAKHLYGLAVDRGSASAMNNLAFMIGKENPDKAKELYRRAIDLGNVAALGNLAEMIETDNPGEAGRLYERAIESGSVRAMSDLAFLLLDENPQKAKSLYEQATTCGDAEAPNMLAAHFYRNSNPTKALELLELATERGSVSGMNNLAYTVQEDNPARAKALYQRASDLGSRDAAFNLAVLLQEENPERAKELYTLATERGDSVAPNNLAIMIEKSNPERAKELYWLATTRGNDMGASNLAEMIEKDDPEKAKKLYWFAARCGNATAMNNLAVMLEPTEPQQAKALWEKAIEANPKDDVIRENYANFIHKELSRKGEEDGRGSNRGCSYVADLDRMSYMWIANLAMHSELPELDLRGFSWPMVYIADGDANDLYIVHDTVDAFVLLDELCGTGIIRFAKTMTTAKTPMPPALAQDIHRLYGYISSCIWGEKRRFVALALIAESVIRREPLLLDDNLLDYLYTIKENRYKEQYAEVGVRIDEKWYWFGDVENGLWGILSQVDWGKLSKGKRRLLDVLKEWKWDLRGAKKVDSYQIVRERLEQAARLWGEHPNPFVR